MPDEPSTVRGHPAAPGRPAEPSRSRASTCGSTSQIRPLPPWSSTTRRRETLPRGRLRSPDDIEQPRSSTSKSGRRRPRCSAPGTSASAYHRPAPPDRPRRAQFRMAVRAVSFRLPADAPIPMPPRPCWTGAAHVVVPPVTDMPAGGDPTRAAMTIRAPTARETACDSGFPSAAPVPGRCAATWRPPHRRDAPRALELWRAGLAGLDREGPPRDVDDKHHRPARRLVTGYVPGVPCPPPATPACPAPWHRCRYGTGATCVLASVFEGYAVNAFSRSSCRNPCRRAW